MNADEKAIAEVLARYQDALNQSSADAVMKLYQGAEKRILSPQADACVPHPA